MKELVTKPAYGSSVEGNTVVVVFHVGAFKIWLEIALQIKNQPFDIQI